MIKRFFLISCHIALVQQSLFLFKSQLLDNNNQLVINKLLIIKQLWNLNFKIFEKLKSFEVRTPILYGLDDL